MLVPVVTSGVGAAVWPSETAAHPRQHSPTALTTGRAHGLVAVAQSKPLIAPRRARLLSRRPGSSVVSGSIESSAQLRGKWELPGAPFRPRHLTNCSYAFAPKAAAGMENVRFRRLTMASAFARTAQRGDDDGQVAYEGTEFGTPSQAQLVYQRGSGMLRTDYRRRRSPRCNRASRHDAVDDGRSGGHRPRSRLFAMV